NAAIVLNSKRWPLMIDPQQQGIEWVKAHHVAGGMVQADPLADEADLVQFDIDMRAKRPADEADLVQFDIDMRAKRPVSPLAIRAAAGAAGASRGGSRSTTAKSRGGATPRSAKFRPESAGDGRKSSAGDSVGNSAALEEWDADGVPLKGAGSPASVVRGGSPVAVGAIRGGSPVAAGAIRGGSPVGANRGASPVATAGMGKGPGSVVTVRMGDKKALERIAMALSFGETLILQDLGEELDSALDAVLRRAVLKRGRSDVVIFRGKEVEYNRSFRLYLQTRLQNPHYRPEVAAQVTMVNFAVTEACLHQQLLSLVIFQERPELAAQSDELFDEQLQAKLAAQSDELFDEQLQAKVRLKEVEDQILEAISSAEGDLLANTTLIEGLERTKATGSEITARQGGLLANTTLVEGLERTKATGSEVTARQEEIARVEAGMKVALDTYHQVASRGVSLWLVLDSLWRLNHLYRFSLTEERKRRVKGLVDGVAESVFDLVSSGLLERDRLALATEWCSHSLDSHGVLDLVNEFILRVALAGECASSVNEFILREAPARADFNPFAEWLGDEGWSLIQALEELEMPQLPFDVHESPETQVASLAQGGGGASFVGTQGTLGATVMSLGGGGMTMGGGGDDGGVEMDRPFAQLPIDLQDSPKRWREWAELEAPEAAPLPGDWAKLPELYRVLVLKAFRPDRLVYAMTGFVGAHLGERYLNVSSSLASLLPRSAPGTPILFVLSPGADPVREMLLKFDAVEELAEKNGVYVENGRLHMVSLGQSQEAVAEAAIVAARKAGGWVLLQNLHMMLDWSAASPPPSIEQLPPQDQR
ncbi:dynein heavy chain and region D6 of dynein motor-domain-containing protein, partial [Baffinella frigidus]